MINHPVLYHRDFRHDVPTWTPPIAPQLWEKCQRIVFAALPILSLHRALRGPISLGMSALRSVTHIQSVIEKFKNSDIKEGAFHFIHATLSLATVGLLFFNPVFSLISSSLSDLVINARSFIEHTRAGNVQEAIKALAFMTLDLLFLTSLCYGTLELTVACMLLQIALNLAISLEHLKKGEYLESICQAILAGAHMYQIRPQIQVLQWKLKNNPVLIAELKQNKNGFTYLDIPDEYVLALFDLCSDTNMELPPYFSRNQAGAHISVILSEEMKARNGLKIDDIGKKFTFRIAHMDSVKPDGWNGVNKVDFLALSCRELELMRMRHGFSPKIGSHDFHMTFGVQRE